MTTELNRNEWRTEQDPRDGLFIYKIKTDFVSYKVTELKDRFIIRFYEINRPGMHQRLDQLLVEKPILTAEDAFNVCDKHYHEVGSKIRKWDWGK